MFEEYQTGSYEMEIALCGIVILHFDSAAEMKRHGDNYASVECRLKKDSEIHLSKTIDNSDLLNQSIRSFGLDLCAVSDLAVFQRSRCVRHEQTFDKPAVFVDFPVVEDHSVLFFPHFPE